MSQLPPVIFEDDSVIAFNKPAGQRVARGDGPPGASLLEAVRERFGGGIAIVHHLDDEASGLVLCAKTKRALDFLSGQFQAKTVEARYHAVTVGLPAADAGVLEFSLAPDETAPERMRVAGRRGSAAITAFAVLGRFQRFGLLECRPQTARRHQIRVHLAAIGTPVLNDARYGHGAVLLLSELKRGYKGRADERPLLSDLALHAAGLTFAHPDSRARVALEAPPPNAFAVALKYLRKFGGGAV